LAHLDPQAHGDVSAATAAAHADLALIPVRPSVLDLDAVGSTLDLITAAKARACVVLNTVLPKGSVADEAAEAQGPRHGLPGCVSASGWPTATR
jgi:chromosome partitioning protein